MSFSNDEEAPITVNFVGGALVAPDGTGRVVRNLTTTSYGVEIPAGEKQTLPFSFATEMQPQDLQLSLASVISDSEGTFYTVQAFNGTVSVVEPEASIFDPQM